MQSIRPKASGPSGADEVRIVEVGKDPGTSHPYRLKEVKEQVNAALGEGTINQYDVQCVNK
jgi:hypothetical protein